MSATKIRRVGGRAAAAALAVALAGGPVLFGAGAAYAAAPREVVCTIGALPAPVSVTQGDSVQLVLVDPVTGARVNVGPSQTVTNPGQQVLSAAANAAGALCQAVVDVQALPTPAVPPPPPPPAPVPSTSVAVPLPGASVQTGGGGGAAPGAPAPGAAQPPPGAAAGPGAGQPQPASQPGGAAVPSFRFDEGRLPLYDFSSVPWGAGTRFGSYAAPAFRFGQQVPGYAPQFGVLGEDAQGDAAPSDVAGKAQALPLGGSTAIALPVLLAVLMLSTVTGALVRTWVLRRSS